MSTALAIEAPSRHVYTPTQIAILNAAEADERFWADVDTFADWLYAQCVGANPLPVAAFLPTTAHGLESMMEPASVALLTALMLNPRGDVRAVASNHLRNRYYEAMHDYRRRIGDIVAAESLED